MKKLILTSLCVLLFAAGTAWADFINLPVKWSQVPWDPDGGAYMSEHLGGQVIADDFVCGTPEHIGAVRWWGSYSGETTPHEWTGQFDISFHYSVGEHPDSLPGPLITMYTVDAQEVFVGYDNSSNPNPVYRYDAYLPESFDQWEYSRDEDYNVGELFIDICKSTLQSWGWREVEPPHPRLGLDYAAGAPTHDGTWGRVGAGTDMAFELMGVPEPTTIVLLGFGSLALLRRKARA